MKKSWSTYFIPALVFYEVFAFMTDFPPISSSIYRHIHNSFAGTQSQIAFIHPLADGELPSSRIKNTGTAILITSDGLAITNNHVVGDCNKVVISHEGERSYARVIKKSASYDIALIKGDIASPAMVKRMKLSAPKLGDGVLVYGFPYANLLSRNGNLTEGIVSALDGGSNAPQLFQFTAPVQSGSSGSGVLNNDGDLIGIVTSKLNALKASKLLGDIPQNINFAVSSEFIKMTFNQLEEYKDPGFLENLINWKNSNQDTLVSSSLFVECY
jgi:S1-C subfamily serine protease